VPGRMPARPQSSASSSGGPHAVWGSSRTDHTSAPSNGEVCAAREAERALFRLWVGVRCLPPEGAHGRSVIGYGGGRSCRPRLKTFSCTAGRARSGGELERANHSVDFLKVVMIRDNKDVNNIARLTDVFSSFTFDNGYPRGSAEFVRGK
jgi:hypothetical protein